MNIDKYKIKILFKSDDGNNYRDHIREEVFDTSSEMDKNYEFFRSLDTVQEIKVYQAYAFSPRRQYEIVKSGDSWYKSVL